MPRRYKPNRRLRILRQYRGDDREYAWEILAEVCAERRDMRGTAPMDDGEYQYTKTVVYVMPKTMRYSDPAPAGGSDALGARELGSVPAGGRAAPAVPRIRATGPQVSPGDAVQDMATYGHPIFRVRDVHELDGRRIELFVERSDIQGAVYGGD